jgi:hypothetical protein
MKSHKIKFSRHAQRRMKLYNISEESVSTLIEQLFNVSKLGEGGHEAVEEAPVTHKYPLKAVFALKENEITVITAYPLKRGV